MPYDHSPYHPFELVTSEAALTELVAELSELSEVCFDLETTSIDSMTCEIVGLCISWFPDADASILSSYIPVGHTQHGLTQLKADQVCAAIAPICADRDITKIFHNGLYDLVVFDRYDVTFENVDDTMLLSYALDVKRRYYNHSMDDCAERHLGKRTIKFNEVVNAHPWIEMENFADVPVDDACTYGCDDTETTLELWDRLIPKLQEKGQWDLYRDIDKPLLMALVDMRINGVGIDRKHLRKLDKEFTRRLDRIHNQIMESAPDLNYGSNKQLGYFMFGSKKDGCLGLTVRETTPTGQPKTDAETLESYSGENPVLDLILKHKALSKLHGTYVTSLLDKVVKETGRLHGSHNQAVTATIRLSSSDPNLQNIPAHSKDGAKLREAFIASPGMKFVGCDYSQIELRVLAQVSGDPLLIDVFNNDRDPHTETVKQLWGLEPGDEDFDLYRFRAKKVNFGVIYGITSIGLSKQVGVDPVEGQELIDAHQRTYLGVWDWIERIQKEGRSGCVKTLFGRLLYLGRGYGAERQAQNYPVQGGAADLMRLAVGKSRVALSGYDAWPLLNVHDELIIECVEDQAETVAATVEHVMVHAGDDYVDWAVPIIAEPKIGNTWKDIK